MTYATDDLYEEIAYVAYKFHWPFDQILELEHLSRRRFIGHIRNFERSHR